MLNTCAADIMHTDHALDLVDVLLINVGPLVEPGHGKHELGHVRQVVDIRLLEQLHV